MKKCILISLTAALLLSTLVSCGEKKEAATDTIPSDTAGATDMETETEETGRTLQDEVPELSFDGTTFRTIVQESTQYDIYAAEQTGDTLNDSIYRRTIDTEERFDIVIAPAEELAFRELSTKILKFGVGYRKTLLQVDFCPKPHIRDFGA